MSCILLLFLSPRVGKSHVSEYLTSVSVCGYKSQLPHHLLHHLFQHSYFSCNLQMFEELLCVSCDTINQHCLSLRTGNVNVWAVCIIVVNYSWYIYEPQIMECQLKVAKISCANSKHLGQYYPNFLATIHVCLCIIVFWWWIRADIWASKQNLSAKISSQYIDAILPDILAIAVYHSVLVVN